MDIPCGATVAQSVIDRTKTVFQPPAFLTTGSVQSDAQ